MIEESKCCSKVMKKPFNKELMITKEDNEDNEALVNVGSATMIMLIMMLKQEGHIIEKHRDFAHRDCNINIKLNYKTPVVFRTLKHYDSHLIMQELGKFNFKINVIPNALEKYVSFIINNKLIFIDSIQFLSSSFDNLIENLSEDDFKYLTQEFDNNVLDIVKEQGFYPYEYMSDFEKFKKELLSKEKFYSSLTGRKPTEKYEHDLSVWNKFEMKTMKDYHDLYLKCDVPLLADVFEKF